MLRSRLAVAERLATSLRLLLTLVFADKQNALRSVATAASRENQAGQDGKARFALATLLRSGAGRREKDSEPKIEFFLASSIRQKKFIKIGALPQTPQEVS